MSKLVDLNNWSASPCLHTLLEGGNHCRIFQAAERALLCRQAQHPAPSTGTLAAAQQADLRQDSNPLFCHIVVQASVLVLRLMLFWGYLTSELKQFSFFFLFI